MFSPFKSFIQYLSFDESENSQLVFTLSLFVDLVTTGFMNMFIFVLVMV